MPKSKPAKTNGFEIERVPLAQKRSRYPFEQLKVEESFFVEDGNEVTLRSLASRRGKSLKRVFSVRRVTEKKPKGRGTREGLRIYRIQ